MSSQYWLLDVADLVFRRADGAWRQATQADWDAYVARKAKAGLYPIENPFRVRALYPELDKKPVTTQLQD